MAKKASNVVTDLSTEELVKQKKTLTGAAFGLGILMLVACLVLFYLVLKSRNYLVMFVIPVAILSLLPSFMRLGQINAELKSRNIKK